MPFNVPNSTAFLGGEIYFQAVLLDPGVSFGISLSHGVEMWIG